jgi:hypothetical protein
MAVENTARSTENRKRFNAAPRVSALTANCDDEGRRLDAETHDRGQLARHECSVQAPLQSRAKMRSGRESMAVTLRDVDVTRACAANPRTIRTGLVLSVGTPSGLCVLRRLPHCIHSPYEIFRSNSPPGGQIHAHERFQPSSRLIPRGCASLEVDAYRNGGPTVRRFSGYHLRDVWSNRAGRPGGWKEGLPRRCTLIVVFDG